MDRWSSLSRPPQRGQVSSSRRRRPVASARRTTSSRASSSAPAWCCSVSWPARSSGAAGDALMDVTVDSTARDQASAVRRKDISARELLDLHLARIAERNPELNAIVSLDEERAREGAAAADEALASSTAVGPLHGLPFAFKDTHAVAGWRTTFGSPLFQDFVPDQDELIVERIRGAGVVVIGKNHVPEFAAGSHTLNKVFGPPLIPVDPSRSAGGSSGG